MFETIFYRVLLSIIVKDHFWRYQLDILHLSFQHNNRGHRKRIFPLKERFATTSRPLTKKAQHGFVYCSTIFVHFTMLAPRFLYHDERLESIDFARNPESIKFGKATTKSMHFLGLMWASWNKLCGYTKILSSQCQVVQSTKT